MSIRARAKTSKGITTVHILLSHPMETGRRKDKTTGKIIPAHFITELTVTEDDKPLIEAMLGAGISRDPLYAFKYKGSPGSELKITWKDNLGQSDSKTFQVS